MGLRVRQNILEAGGCRGAKLLNSWRSGSREGRRDRDRYTFKDLPSVTYSSHWAPPSIFHHQQFISPPMDESIDEVSILMTQSNHFPKGRALNTAPGTKITVLFFGGREVGWGTYMPYHI
jgi:hypothetical protein